MTPALVAALAFSTVARDRVFALEAALTADLPAEPPGGGADWEAWDTLWTRTWLDRGGAEIETKADAEDDDLLIQAREYLLTLGAHARNAASAIAAVLDRKDRTTEYYTTRGACLVAARRLARGEIR